MSHEMRAARPADAAALARLHIASWRATYQDQLPGSFLAHLDAEERTRVWQDRVAAPDYHTHIVADHDEVIAFCGSGPDTDGDADARSMWQIHNLHVAPTLKRSGLGGRLFDAAVELARAHGATALTLWVASNNHAARRFYEKKGMTPDGAEQIYEFAPGAALVTVRYRMSIT